MSVLIVDYGLGNLGSVSRTFEKCGADVFVDERPESVEEADHIVIPGVGDYAEAMLRITQAGWDVALRRAALEEKIPILGICLGMQLLSATGEESGLTQGLGLIEGRVVRLEASDANERIPHVGWNEVYPVEESPLFLDIAPGTDFYFVHSYHFNPAHAADAAAVTPYCGEFVSAVSQENIHGVQFHPEKSSKAGMTLIRNFIEL